MGMNKQSGFTIIEVLLFLGITGLMAAALLGGWTTMINNQRYKDSVKTLQSFIQQQYNLVYNVQNGRNAETGCVIGADGPVFTDEDDDASTLRPQGQSVCVVMGRYIHISGGSVVKVYPIVGEDRSEAGNPSDKQAILDRKPVEVTEDIGLAGSELNIPWQAEVVTPVPNSVDTMDVAIVIIRSPESGIVHTYSQQLPDGSRPPTQSIITDALNEDMNLCLNPDVAFVGSRTGVVIRKGASVQSYVQTITDTEGLCS